MSVHNVDGGYKGRADVIRASTSNVSGADRAGKLIFDPVIPCMEAANKETIGTPCIGR